MMTAALILACELAVIYGARSRQLNRAGARVGWWFYRRAMTPIWNRAIYLDSCCPADPIEAVIEGFLADQERRDLSPTEREVREQMRRGQIPVYRELHSYRRSCHCASCVAEGAGHW